MPKAVTLKRLTPVCYDSVLAERAERSVEDLLDAIVAMPESLDEYHEGATRPLVKSDLEMYAEYLNDWIADLINIAKGCEAARRLANARRS